jgi:NET1-associated nuclear protein 1 (U3 small nucleolar RNA-associated protein 17)
MDSDNNMASVLKRKRAPVEVLDTPKRAKSSEAQPGDFFQKPSGWDAAFRPPPKVTTNGEGKHLLSNGQLASPDAEAIEFDQFVTGRNAIAEVSGKKKKKEKKEKKHKNTTADKRSWRISGPIGGRMIDADPVFTADEKYVAGL